MTKEIYFWVDFDKWVNVCCVHLSRWEEVWVSVVWQAFHAQWPPEQACTATPWVWARHDTNPAFTAEQASLHQWCHLPLLSQPRPLVRQPLPHTNWLLLLPHSNLSVCCVVMGTVQIIVFWQHEWTVVFTQLRLVIIWTSAPVSCSGNSEWEGCSSVAVKVYVSKWQWSVNSFSQLFCQTIITWSWMYQGLLCHEVLVCDHCCV